MGLAGSWQPAQGVVGYVNVTVKPGYNLIHNPLHVAPSNSIASVIPSPPPGFFRRISTLEPCNPPACRRAGSRAKLHLGRRRCASAR